MNSLILLFLFVLMTCWMYWMYSKYSKLLDQGDIYDIKSCFAFGILVLMGIAIANKVAFALTLLCGLVVIFWIRILFTKDRSAIFTGAISSGVLILFGVILGLIFL